MFKKLTAVIICFSLIFCNIGIASADLGQNPPQPVNNPNILSVLSSVTNATSGNVSSVQISVTTVNINDNTEISAQLMSDDLSTQVSGVNAAVGQISGNKATLNLSIPASVEAGTYRIRVNINALSLANADTSFIMNPPASVPVNGVVLNKSTLSLVAGTQENLVAEISPLNATDKSVIWTSNNQSVATIDGSGRISAISAGNATITVTTEDGSKTATCLVTVLAANVSVNAVSLDKSTVSLNVGAGDTLTATISPSNASNKKVSWSSSDTAIVTVDNNGRITAHATGTAVITASSEDGNKSATCQVTVTSATVNVTSVALNKATTSLNVGAEETLAATVAPTNATNKNVTWSSSNTAIATVSSTGVVRGISAGTATITVTTVNGNKSATCQVTVTSATVNVTSVTLNKAASSLNVGVEETLTAIIAPTNATNKNVTWASSNTAIATVSSTGVVKGISVGTATITVTSVSGNKTDTCQVTVTNPTVNVTSVTLNKATTSMNVGLEETLTATVAPTNAANKNVTWSSSNTAIATVSSTGVVRGISAGTATITVTTVNGSKTATCQVTVTSATVNVTSVALNKAATSLNVGAEETLAATVAPTNAANKNVTWSSSNTAIATVSSTGVVRGISAGTATITVTTVDGGRTTICQVTVLTATPAPTPTPTPAPAQTPSPVVPVITAEKGTANVEVIPVLNPTTGAATTKVTVEQIAKAIETVQATTNAEVKLALKVEAVKDAKSYVQELPASVMTAESKVNKIEIETPVAKVEIKPTMLNKVKTEKTDVVGISIEIVKAAALPAEVGKAIGDRPVIDLNVSVNGSNIKWDNAAVPVTVTVPYVPTKAELAKLDNIVIWYISDDGKIEPVPNCRFDVKTNTIIFKTTHFSKYAVAFVEKTYKDISDVQWAKSSIEALASRSVIDGMAADKFEPKTDITRGDFVKWVVGALGLSAEVDTNFSDVDRSASYYHAVAVAKKLGVVLGDNGKFRPTDKITRQDLMTIVQRAMTVAEVKVSAGTQSDLVKFKDKDKVAKYAVSSMASLVKDGIINGSSGNLNPLSNTSRAEAAVIIYRVSNK